MTTTNDTYTTTGGWTPVPGGIDPATRLGHVHLTVLDLKAQLAFYQNVLGLRLQWQEGDTAALGTGGGDLLRLTERPNAHRAYHTSGLYHFCLLVPRRVELAQLLRRIAETKTPVQGLVDHLTSEAIYLADPEGNGIELDSDWPREQWPTPREMVRRGNEPLDVEGLLAELSAVPNEWAGLPPDTTIGHVHLHVADLAAARHFYHDLIGFDETMQFPGQAGFVSAGGYHHHVAYNIWAGVGAPPPPEGALGLRHFTIRLPREAELERIVERLRGAGVPVEDTDEGLLTHDPSRNGVLLTTATATTTE
jgi:catechol 2,3-dioxygenase